MQSHSSGSRGRAATLLLTGRAVRALLGTEIPSPNVLQEKMPAWTASLPLSMAGKRAGPAVSPEGQWGGLYGAQALS